MSANLNCKTFPYALVNYYIGLLNDASTNGAVIQLAFFNIDKVLNEQEDINLLKATFGNALYDKVLNRVFLINSFLQFNHCS